MQLIVIGTGKAATQIFQYPLKKDVEVVVCDNDKSKWGKDFFGYKINSLDIIDKTQYDKVLLALWNGKELNDLLIQLAEKEVSKDKIVFSYDPSIVRFCESELDRFFQIPKVDYEVKFEKNHVLQREECRGETSKSYERRLREGFFDKYCQGEGLDIGCGADPITPSVSGWDILNGDAQYLKGIEDESFDYVYSSHCLEHLRDVRVSIRNWYRVVKKGGYLIIAVPHRDLFEKRKTLPSMFNGDHKHMFLLGESEEPDTLDILEEIEQSIKNYDIVYAKICDEGYTNTDSLEQSNGEYQIEVVIRKRM